MADQMTDAPVGVGIVGCGNIFESYITGLRKLRSVRVLGCADIDQARAEAAGNFHDLRAYDSVEALLDDEQVDLVVNITPPIAHGSVSLAALAGSKHVYSEKPMSASLEEAGRVLTAASGTARLGCATDTFLAGPGQTARAAIDSGLIGEPVGFSAAIPHSRAEEWHPDPTFLYKKGGGPLLDMGPYYVSNLVNCLGPVRTVTGSARIGANPRIVTTPGRLVDSIVVEVPTHAVAVLSFVSGTVGTLTASFDLWSDHLPHIEVYGTKGILRLPDPDRFDGDVVFKPNGSDTWEVVAPVLQLAGWWAEGGRIRGLGVADLVDSLRGRPQRASAELGYHVLEILDSVETASITEAVVHLKDCTRRVPSPWPPVTSTAWPSPQTVTEKTRRNSWSSALVST